MAYLRVSIEEVFMEFSRVSSIHHQCSRVLWGVPSVSWRIERLYRRFACSYYRTTMWGRCPGPALLYSLGGLTDMHGFSRVDFIEGYTAPEFGCVGVFAAGCVGCPWGHILANRCESSLLATSYRIISQGRKVSEHCILELGRCPFSLMIHMSKSVCRYFPYPFAYIQIFEWLILNLGNPYQTLDPGYINAFSSHWCNLGVFAYIDITLVISDFRSYQNMKSIQQYGALKLFIWHVLSSTVWQCI